MEGCSVDGWFNCLPIVDTCCCFVKNLRIATIIISIVCLISTWTIYRIVHPDCSNMHANSGVGFAVKVFSYTLSVIIIICSSASLFMFIFACQDYPVVVPFIICTWILSITSIITSILEYVRMSAVNFDCQNYRYQKAFGRKKFIGFTLELVWSWFWGLVNVYFSIVVNSYAARQDKDAILN